MLGLNSDQVISTNKLLILYAKDTVGLISFEFVMLAAHKQIVELRFVLVLSLEEQVSIHFSQGLKLLWRAA